MNPPAIVRRPSVCPHDCPSACALDVEVIDGKRIGRVRGAKDQTYTAGIVCAKVARYAERIHHPDRLLHPLRRTGPKGSGAFARISWDEALATIVERFDAAERAFGAQSVWPYFYSGTMGRVMRDGVKRLTNAKKYSRFNGTICVGLAWPGFAAGAGRISGPDPREMGKSDCVVLWGTNAVATQVNVMTHVTRARKERGAKLVVVDIYDNATMRQADMALCIRPGTDGALACAVMHALFRDGFADRAYLAKYTDAPDELEAHLAQRSPVWAAAITGLRVEEIEAFAQLVGQTKRTYFRLGYGFSRQRNGAVNMHAASCIPAVTGAWLHEGGGAFHNNAAIFHWSQKTLEGADLADSSVRVLDQSRVGAILCGDPDALRGGPPVKAMLIQNTNPLSVAPDQTVVKRGFAREDLFVAVHEQFMTETAEMADIVLPATMFMEHDDIYSGGGHQYVEFGGKLIEPPGECRNNHEVICALAAGLGVKHAGFDRTPVELAEVTLRESNLPPFSNLVEKSWIDVQPDFRAAHFIDGFAWPDGKFRFRVDWPRVPYSNNGPVGSWRAMPTFPDHWDVIETANEVYPFRLATSPAHSFLNSTFNETRSSIASEGAPCVLVHPEDAARLEIRDGDLVSLGNARGEITLMARVFAGLQPGVLISEGLWPNSAFPGGRGVNTLTGADPVAPFGGSAFHDNRVWMRPA